MADRARIVVHNGTRILFSIVRVASSVTFQATDAGVLDIRGEGWQRVYAPGTWTHISAYKLED